jgi:hypothetical protein
MGVSERVNVFEYHPGEWWAECLVCSGWVSTRNATRREAEQSFGRHWQNDPHPLLSVDERSLLSEAVDSRAPELSPLVDKLDRGTRLSPEEANALRDAVGDELAATGVTDGAINDRGLRLDDLIDRVGRASHLFDQ